jgi:hypothetical protein
MHVPHMCFPALFAIFGTALPAPAQSIVSTHAGVIHYFEGDVSIAGTALQPQFGRFPEIPEGAELQTTEGRAEVLLGPGVILRLAENSALKMISSSLADARLEILSGAAILNAKDPLPGNSLALLYKSWEVRIPKQGVYRIDTDPEQLRVYFGEVEVRAAKDAPVVAKAGQTLPLAAVLVPDLTLGPPGDEFNRWAFDRGEAISADNATAAQIVDDPALYPATDLSGLALAGYTYFPPTIGSPYLGYGGYGGYPYAGYGGYGGYGFGNPYLGSYFSPRFGQSSVYTYRPIFPGLSGVSVQPPHLRLPGGGAPPPRPGLHSPSLPRPVPVTPHPAPHPVIRGGRR